VAHGQPSVGFISVSGIGGETRGYAAYFNVTLECMISQGYPVDISLAVVFPGTGFLV
jgi:hypothetical protein